MAARTVLCHRFADPPERHAMHDDLLVFRAATFADLGQPGGAQQDEAFAQHPGRGIEFAELLPLRRAVVGFLFEFALGAG